LRQLLNPGGAGLPVDPLSALFCRGFIDEGSYNAGRYFSGLVAIARGGLDLRDASVAHPYRRMVTGVLGEENAILTVDGNGLDCTAADHARNKLAEMRAELWRPGEDGAVFHVVMAVCIDSFWAPWIKRLLIG
jgi:hypothetical protein